MACSWKQTLGLWSLPHSMLEGFLTYRLSITTYYLSPGPSNGTKQPWIETSEIRARINLGVVANEYLSVCLSVCFCLFSQLVAALGDGIQGRVHAKQASSPTLSYILCLESLWKMSSCHVELVNTKGKSRKVFTRVLANERNSKGSHRDSDVYSWFVRLQPGTRDCHRQGSSLELSPHFVASDTLHIDCVRTD